MWNQVCSDGNPWNSQSFKVKSLGDGQVLTSKIDDPPPHDPARSLLYCWPRQDGGDQDPWKMLAKSWYINTSASRRVCGKCLHDIGRQWPWGIVGCSNFWAHSISPPNSIFNPINLSYISLEQFNYTPRCLIEFRLVKNIDTLIS